MQKQISRRISSVLTRSFNTTTIVGRISYSLDNKFVLKNLYVEDYNLDTLFFVDKVRVKVWEIFRDQVNFSRLQIDGLKLRIKQDTNGYTNLLVFLDNLPTNPQKKKKSKSHIKIKVNEIDIRNFDISYTSSLDSVYPGKFSPKNFHIYPLNLTIKDLNISDSLYSLSLYDFSFKDRESGFVIKNISTDLLFSNRQFRIKDLVVDLSQSHLYLPIFQVHYDSIAQLSDPKSLDFLMILDTSTVIKSQDIKYFAPELKNNFFSFRLGLTAFGSMSNINILPVYLQFGQGTRLKASAHIIGLPDITHTYIDISLDTIQFLLRDITSVRDTNGRPVINLPRHMYKLSSFNANGQVTGLVNDFSAFVHFNSNLGSINTQFNVSITDNRNINGFIHIDSLQIGRILDNKKLGTITLADTFDIFNKEKQFWGTSYGKIYSLQFNGYNYHDIEAQASFDNQDLSASVKINDPNLVFTLNALANNKGKQGYHTKFMVNLGKINFYPLHFDKEDPNSRLTMAMSGELWGHDINDFYGKISFTRPLVYIKNLEKIEIQQFEFTSVLKQYIQGLPFKEMFIKSDLLDASMIGVFELSSLSHYFQSLVSYFFPSLGKGGQKTDLFISSPQNIGANLITQINLKDLTPITRIFAPNITLAPHTIVQGIYKAIDNQFVLKINSDSLLLGKNKLIKPQITVNTSDDTLKMVFSSDNAGFGIFKFQNLNIWTKGKNDTISFGYAWKNKSEQKNFGLINGLITLSRPQPQDTLLVTTTIKHDSVFINGIRWDIQDLVASIRKNIIQINSYFQNPDKHQAIGIVGKISPNPNDKLFIRTQLFDISQLNPILHKIKLEGYLNGNTLVRNIYANPIITSDNVISNLRVNDVDLQMLTAISRYDAQKGIVSFKIYTEKSLGELKPKDTIHERFIDIKGRYNIENKAYNVNINFRKFKLKAFYPYFQQVISAISRFTTIHGKIDIQGQGKDANIKGDLGITNAAFKLRPTNVTYTVNGIMGIHFHNDNIKIDTTTIISQGGTGKAKLWGNVYKNQFDDYVYNIRFVPDTFMVLNLPNNGQQPYYGKAFVTGTSDITGIGNSLSINADLRTEENTDLTFLVNSPKKISAAADFITFVSHDTNMVKIPAPVKSGKSNIDLNINLEVNPLSKFAIVIDEQTGEKFLVQGSGLLNIKLSPYGDFLLSGTLTIEKGEYNFTLENIVNKKFQIQQGSTIKWNGSPQDADLDLTAIYKVNNANLYDLTLDDNYWNVRTPVNCLIHIKGKLTEPDISFDLDLPKADQRIVSQVQNLESAEKTKQVLSLLIIGKFQPLPGLAFNPNQLTQNTSATDVLSTQLSNLISSIDPNLELGLNYQAQQGVLSPEQLELALSYKLWDERIIINTDVGIGSNSQPTVNNNAKQFIGDVDIEVKLNKRGNIRLKAFNQTNRNEFFDKGPYTQGVGIFFQKDFTSLIPKEKRKKKQHERKRKKQGTSNRTR